MEAPRKRRRTLGAPGGEASRVRRDRCDPRALARREAEVPEAVARASIGAVIILTLNCGTGPGPPVGRWTSAEPSGASRMIARADAGLAVVGLAMVRWRPSRGTDASPLAPGPEDGRAD